MENKKVMKKPGAAGKPAMPVAVAAGRPAMPPDNTSGKSIPYARGKVLVSQSLESYRVFKKVEDRVDYRMRWRWFQTRQAAWSASLDYIDGKKIDYS